MVDERCILVYVHVHNEVINEILGLTERSMTRTRASGWPALYHFYFPHCYFVTRCDEFKSCVEMHKIIDNGTANQCSSSSNCELALLHGEVNYFRQECEKSGDNRQRPFQRAFIFGFAFNF